MANLQEMANQIGGFFEDRYRRFSRASMLIKVGLVIGGSALAGIAHFQIEGAGFTAWQIVGIAGAVAVAFGGVYLVIAEAGDPAKELETARKALEAAREQEYELEWFNRSQEEYDKMMTRAIELYRAMDQMRSVVQKAVANPNLDETGTIRAMLEASERSLKIASGFELTEHWTLGVYKAEDDATSERTLLVCVAHLRSIPCDISAARKWPEGVGAAGAAYAIGGEVIVPDLQATEIGNRFGTSGATASPDDETRYRSIVAVPVMMAASARPWGTVVATSDRTNHFLAEERPSIRTFEATRALAGMVELALEARNSLQLSVKKS